jgi:hypothetical protein
LLDGFEAHIAIAAGMMLRTAMLPGRLKALKAQAIETVGYS